MIENSKMPPDVMCTGEKCDLRTVCWRFKAKPDKDQKYFENPPMKTWLNEGKLNRGRKYLCEEFWVLSEDYDAWNALSDKITKEDAWYFRNKGKL